MNENFEKVAKALDSLGKKYNIPMKELEPIAELCGTAIAQAQMDKVPEGDDGVPPEGADKVPMDTAADELAGALGGR